MTRYVPILKGKPAEFNALAFAGTGTRAGLLPLVEPLPAVDDTNPSHVEVVCRDSVSKISMGWGGQDLVVIDSVYQPNTMTLGGGLLPVEVLAEEARKQSVRAVPVVRLNDPGAVTAAIATIAATDGRGVMIRLASDDLEEDASDIEIWLNDLLTDLGLAHGDADLLIDMGAISETALAARAARDLLRGLPSVPMWRSVTLAAGAFPANLNGIPAASADLLPRRDALLWRSVVARPLPRTPDFGDYAIQHPNLPATGGFGPAPQIRYTLADDWRVRKGSKRDPRGHAQFYDHCAALVAAGEASPSTLSYGDDYVAKAAASAPPGAAPAVTTGNATTWRAIGTSHHMAYVTDRLATTGAP